MTLSRIGTGYENSKREVPEGGGEMSPVNSDSTLIPHSETPPDPSVTGTGLGTRVPLLIPLTTKGRVWGGWGREVAPTLRWRDIEPVGRYGLQLLECKV